MATTSYSQSSLYVSCPQAWYNRYVQKLDSVTEGASLSFGTAFDAAIAALLENKPDYMEIFNKKWFSTTNRKKELVPIFDSPTIVYANNDFDKDVLQPEDLQTLLDWASELKIVTDNGVLLMETILKNKKNPYKFVSEKEIQFFNRASWLSLKRKGELLVEAFKEQFLPQVEEVVAIQKHAYLKDNTTGDAVTGYIDFVLKIKGYDKPIIFDLKTSSALYKQDQIDNSDQLTLYVAIDGHRFNTDIVGYAVCIKNIKKEIISYCVECGYQKDGQHKTCPAPVKPDPNWPQEKLDEFLKKKPARCNGEWKDFKVLRPEVQVLIEKKSHEQMKSVLVDQANILEGMKQEIIYKNTSKCNNWYGGKCPYFNLCHNNDMTGLKKKD